MKGFLNSFVKQIKYPEDRKHRYVVIAHLFDDTQRMLDALSSRINYDAVVGVPYSSSKPETVAKWQQNPAYGSRVSVQNSLAEMDVALKEKLDQTLQACSDSNQELIVVDCGGYAAPLLHQHFPDQLHLVKGVVEITKQGVWRAQAIPDLSFPVYHCADSELKRLEAKRCGETVARCIDGVARNLGLSLAGRQATVFGAGWIGTGVMTALQRLDMIPTVVDTDPVKVIEARLNGFNATDNVEDIYVEESDLLVGTTGQTSITSDVLDRVSGGTMIASASSRQMEVDMGYLKSFDATPLSSTVDSYQVENSMGTSPVLLLNDGFPVNFIPASGSVADEIVEMILAEMVVLMQHVASNQHKATPGVHRIPLQQERRCAKLWLQHRHYHQPGHVHRRYQHGQQMRAFSTSRSSSTTTTAGGTRPLAVVAEASKNSMSTATAAASQQQEGLAAAPLATTTTTTTTTTEDHSPYLVQRLIGQKPNLYGVAKFAIISQEIRRVSAHLDRPVRILDLGCSTSISKNYLLTELGEGTFEYCGVDYEAAFEPDLVMDIREIHERREEIPWQPDVILLLDVLEHLPGKAVDIARVMNECDRLVPEHGLVLAVVPQLYRMDRLKLSHLHYPEHQVRFTLQEWYDIIEPVTTITKMHGIGYISVLSYLPMLSPLYKEDNNHGALFRYLRGTLLEWAPLKPLEIALTRLLGRTPPFQGWCNSSLLVCERSDKQKP